MRKKSYNNKGFTLVELLLAISLVAVIIILSFNMFIFGNKTQKMTINQYDIQSSARITSEKINDIVRYSKAVFAVPETFVEITGTSTTMDAGWNYLMTSSEGSKIVNMKYNNETDEFDEEILVDSQDGIKYELIFEKEPGTDKIIRFKINVYNVDNDGKIEKEKLIFESSVDAVNTIQIVDRGTSSAPAVALAYRGDGTATGEGIKQVSYVTFIIDVSGSMSDTPDDETPKFLRWENGVRIYEDSRMDLVKQTLNKPNGIIDKFSKEDGIYISLVPFSTTANYPSTTTNNSPSSFHPTTLAKSGEFVVDGNPLDIKTTINNLNADGGTNTGDGLRRAYHLHQNFDLEAHGLPSHTEVSHYTILLIDGKTTFETHYVDWSLTENSSTSHYVNYNETERTGSWLFGTTYQIFKQIPNELFYLEDGNIDIKNYRNYRSIFASGLTDFTRHSRTKDDSIYYFSTNHDIFRNYSGNISKYIPNNPTNKPAITGTGYAVDEITNSSFITNIGQKIKDTSGTSNKINSYIIGFASDVSDEIIFIGSAIGTDSDNIYDYSSIDFNLNEIYDSIADDILANQWIITGPQIKN